MRQAFKTGDSVIWRWDSGYAHGTIISIDTGKDPIVTIIDHNNTKVLKLASELQGKGD